jgi:hypothetical protein
MRSVVDEVGTLVVTAGPDKGLRFEIIDRPVATDGRPASSCATALSRACTESLENGRALAHVDQRCRVRRGDRPESRSRSATVLKVGVEARCRGRSAGRRSAHGRSARGSHAARARRAARRCWCAAVGGRELVARALTSAARAPTDRSWSSTRSRARSGSGVSPRARRSPRTGSARGAHGGTLFIDEIGELPIELQPKLLRFLEDATVQRLGDSSRARVDARVVAATHRPLERMMNEGTFREDLYYRLAVIELRLPPLRDRPEDVALIAHSLLAELAPNDATLARALDSALEERRATAGPATCVSRLRPPPGVRRAIGGPPPRTAEPTSDPLEPPSENPIAEAKQAGTR